MEGIEGTQNVMFVDPALELDIYSYLVYFLDETILVEKILIN